MSQVLKLGIIAAGLQLIIVTLVMCFVSITSLRELVIPAMKRSTPEAEFLYVYLLLRWLFFLVAVGIALTDTRSATLTAAQIRHVSRLMKPIDPDDGAKKLLALFGFSALGFAILTLDQPPDLIVGLGGWFKNSTPPYIMWSGLMSIGVGYFGAITYAARRAVRAIE